MTHEEAEQIRHQLGVGPADVQQNAVHSWARAIGANREWGKRGFPTLSACLEAFSVLDIARDAERERQDDAIHHAAMVVWDWFGVCPWCGADDSGFNTGHTTWRDGPCPGIAAEATRCGKRVERAGS